VVFDPSDCAVTYGIPLRQPCQPGTQTHLKSDRHRGPRALIAVLAVAPIIGHCAEARAAASPLATGFSAGVVAVNPVTNKVYVGDVGLSADVEEPGGQYPVSEPITVIDASTGTVATLSSSSIWTDIEVNAVTNKIYVADGSLWVIDGLTNVVTHFPELSGEHIAVNQVTDRIYILHSQGNVEGSVTVVDGATDTAITTIDVAGEPLAIAINSVTNKVYVGNEASNYVTVIDGITNSVTAVDVGAYTAAIAVNLVTNKAYVGGTGVTVIDGVTNVASKITAVAGQTAIAVNPLTNGIYATDTGSGDLMVIDGATNAVSNVPVGPFPTGLAVNQTTNQVFVSSQNDENLTVIDGTTNAVAASFSTGGAASGAIQGYAEIALNPVSNNVYIPTSAGVYVIGGNGSTVGPSFSMQPVSQRMNLGTPIVMNAIAGSASSTTYLWLKDGVPFSNGAGITGSTTPTLFITRGASLADTGVYSCVATNSAGGTSSSQVALSVANDPSPGRIKNLSSRASVAGANAILISGFVVRGVGSKSLILRGAGPALTNVGVAGILPNPALSLYDGASPANLVTEDSGWQNPPMVPIGPWAGLVSPFDSTASDFAQVGAFGFGSGSNDSAIGIALPAGAYTCQLAGATTSQNLGTTTGVALAEIYDADTGTPGADLVNISSRAFVGTGANILIDGFVIGGSTSQTVLIRASGPALGSFGISGLLADPQISLFNGSGQLVASNAGWDGNAQIATAAAISGAFLWSDPSSSDSAMLLTLPPGSYTAQVSGQSGDTGIALAEVYIVPPSQ
jgi:YVTN family beta-propeller protein